MEAREINSKLLELLPKAKELFNSVTNWQDGLDTGSTIVMEDVFMVYLKEWIEKNDSEELSNCTAFVEWFSDYIDDEYIQLLSQENNILSADLNFDINEEIEKNLNFQFSRLTFN